MTDESPPIQDHDEPNDISFTLPPTMTIETAEAVAAVFKELPIAEKMVLTLDASQVESITTPGMQIILSLEKSLNSCGGVLVVNGTKESLVAAFTDLGLQRLLGQATVQRR